MIKFLAPPSPETRDFPGLTRAESPRRPSARARAIAEAILTAEQKAALASYDAPRFTQGGVPCARPKVTK